MNAVIMSFEKQSVIRERKLWKRMRSVLNQLGKLKISCTRPVKECQKLVGELCICMMSNNHNVLHCVNIRPKCLAVRTNSRTDS